MGGATFPMPIYKELSKIYYEQTKNEVSYSGGGSGKGIASIKLPNADIIVIVRSDASGTTFNFTNYLANDERWRHKYSVAKSINWQAKVTPVASNPLMATMIEKTPFSIGYLEYSYAKNIGLASLKNSENEYIAPSPASFALASKNANFSAKMAFTKFLQTLVARGRIRWILFG